VANFERFPYGAWLVDFEFYCPEGHRPRPLCVVAKELHSGRTIRKWLGDTPPATCPFPIGPGALYVAHLASAEIGCHLALGWGVPANVIDTFAEFRCLTSGMRGRDDAKIGASLLRALQWFGLEGIDAAEKDDMRELAMRGGIYSQSEREALIDYCETDVTALSRLLPKMAPHLDLPRAMIRGRYMSAVAAVERQGIPIDVGRLEAFREGWEDIKAKLIEETDRDFGVHDGQTFKASRWLAWCHKNGVPWPLLESGKPDLKRDTFREVGKSYPEVLPMHELRTTLSELRLNSLAVGPDRRNRYLSGVFRSKTGRNQPSNSKGVFGPARWIRHLIKPEPGQAVAYVDWSQQEMGIGAVLSGDESLMKLYRASDPYLAFAFMAGAAPEGATKATHKAVRDQYKAALLGTQYGIGAEALARQIGGSEALGYRLLRQHRELFPRFWKWSDDQVDRAMLGYPLRSVFGWQLHTGYAERPTTYRNWMIQSTGADMLRLAVIALVEHGLKVCAMVHDAILIEAATDNIDEAAREAQRLMAAASRAVLKGFELGTDAETFGYPDGFTDERGGRMFDLISRLAGVAPTQQGVAPTQRGVAPTQHRSI
jgi:DNA polymerase-1